MKEKLLVLFFLLLFAREYCSKTDYYELLGVSKHADNLEIRKAFKKLAVKLHPDKNQDDPNAHETFIKLTRAYEVLKDPSLRKDYDKFGDDKPSETPKYHSWSYYSDHFGIYDDDPGIVTLSASDFAINALQSESPWFIKFYSPMCSHCHTLAPTWRKLAIELSGVVKFGVVNCEEEWNLCRQEEIRSYPTLIFYPSRIRYEGGRDKYSLTKFILDHVETNIISLNYPDDWDSLVEKSSQNLWIFLLCNSSSRQICLQGDERIKLAAMVANFIGFGVINCEQLEDVCDLLSSDESSSSVIFWNKEKASGTPILSNDPEKISNALFDLLPAVTVLNAEAIESIMEQLKGKDSLPWLIIFSIQYDEKLELELKKLPALLSNINVGKVYCSQMASFCQNSFIMRYPEFVVYKPGGGYEFYHGQHFAYDIALFAREAYKALNYRSISYDDFEEIVAHKNSENVSQSWLVDFYMPWCPPCITLLPHLREASLQVSNVMFGVVDCTIHQSLCTQQKISSYPTTILIHNNTRHIYKGEHSANSIVEFINDLQNPIVQKLNEESFYSTVGRKSSDALWVVDFFMPWCGPCQQLAPQFRKLAKLLSGIPNIFLATVNCEEEGDLCRQQGIRSYPHIRLYPLASEGLNTMAIFSGYPRDAFTLRRWILSFLPSLVEDIDPESFPTKILDTKDPWIIDFYAPWCGHCHSFEPEFTTVAQKLNGRVKAGKINCDSFHSLCRNAGVTAYPTVKFYHSRSQRGYNGMEISSQKASVIIDTIENILQSYDSSTPHDEL